MLRISNDLPIIYNKNKKTFVLILSILIGLLYLAMIATNGIKEFINLWKTDPDQECYIVVPHEGNTAKLKNDVKEIENFLKKSKIIKSFEIIAESNFRNILTTKNQNNNWLDSMPLPVIVELKLKRISEEVFIKLEKDLSAVVKEAKVQTQLRHSSEFINSLNILSNIMSSISLAISLVIFAVTALMVKALFAQQEKNIEKLLLLGVTPDYICKLYCVFTARSIILSVIYGFLSAVLIISISCLATETINFLPYGFRLPSWTIYLGIPFSCLATELGITYLLVSNLQKKHFTCA